MKTITCQSCGSTVKVIADNHSCSVCDAHFWGYTKETLPKEFQSLMSFVKYKTERDRGATGWLILYNEGKENIIYALQEGENLIGRANPDLAPNIPIENDEFVSRNHALVTVTLNPFGEYVYILYDSKSTNGTFVNTERIQKENPYELRDGDTIQVGETKLVLKTIQEASNQEDAVALVTKMEHLQTVSIKNLRKTSIMTRIIKK